MKTLIVDDEILNCKLLQSILKGFGECNISMDGDEALTFFKMAIETQKPYDLVCLDIMMPEKDGYMVLRAMRNLELKAQVEKKSRIIMVTALDEEKDKKKALLGEDCDGYLVKPVEQKLLFEVLNKINLISL